MPKHILTILFQYFPLHNLAPLFHSITPHNPILHNFTKTTLISTFLALGIAFLHHTIAPLYRTKQHHSITEPHTTIPSLDWASLYPYPTSLSGALPAHHITHQNFAFTLLCQDIPPQYFAPCHISLPLLR